MRRTGPSSSPSECPRQRARRRSWARDPPFLQTGGSDALGRRAGGEQLSVRGLCTAMLVAENGTRLRSIRTVSLSELGAA